MVTGVNVLKSPQKLESWRVDGSGATQLNFGGNAVVHVYVEGGEVVILGQAGDLWPTKKTGDTWTVRAWLSADLSTWKQVLEFPSGDAVTAIAWWRGHLFIGSEQGQVWRAEGAWPRK